MNGSPVLFLYLSNCQVSQTVGMRQLFSRVEQLERELNLRQLQVNRLLNITQAINNNVSARDLFGMYQSFLAWELGVERMALFVRKEEVGQWYCAAQLGLEADQFADDIADELKNFTELVNLEAVDHPFLNHFDLVIPVLHKEHPIAYVFIGGFGEEEDMYERVQFITTITNIIAVAIENKRLFKRQLEQERLRREMDLAIEVQRLLIPDSLPTKDCYSLSSIYQPHFGVGGDYFDFLEFDDGKIVFCIGDFSGKGVSAALLMANFQANFHTLISKQIELDEFVAELNDSVNRITGGDRFITFFIAKYDIVSRELRYVNAGHNPPLLICDGRVQFLKKGSTILGSFQQLPEIEVGSVVLKDNSTVLAYTDGLSDIQNDGGDYFDDKALIDFALQHANLSAVDINQSLLEVIDRFRGGQAYPDDFTVLTCQFYETATPCD